MTDIILTIPNDKINLVVDAICVTRGYQETIDEEPNPETKPQFAKKVIGGYVRDIVKAYEKRLHEAEFVETEISIT